MKYGHRDPRPSKFIGALTKLRVLKFNDELELVVVNDDDDDDGDVKNGVTGDPKATAGMETEVSALSLPITT
jgi:hypothetical protein